MNGLQTNYVSGRKILDAINGTNGKDYSNLVNLSYHNFYPYVSICYNHDCNLSHFTNSNWDEVTFMSRGIIINNDTGEIVSKAFNKFFNYDPQFHKLDITKDSYILEKLDGSLGITYWSPDKKEIYIATKNSFGSDMALFGNYWLYEINAKKFFNPDITYLFEIIYPENRIVIDYGSRKECVLLAMIETSTGQELPYEDTIEFANNHNISVPKKYEFKNFKEVMNMCDNLPWNEEGFVVNVPTSAGICKFKLKGEQYKTVHHTAFSTGSRALWKMVRDEINIEEAISFLPKELKDEKMKIYNDILCDRNKIIYEAKSLFNNIYESNMSRKDFALKAKSSKFSQLMFLLFDNKLEHLNLAAVKMIEDKYKQKGEIDGDE